MVYVRVDRTLDLFACNNRNGLRDVEGVLLHTAARCDDDAHVALGLVCLRSKKLSISLLRAFILLNISFLLCEQSCTSQEDLECEYPD